MSRPISKDLIILDIGINLCLNCPYDDCIATDELCNLLKKEVIKVREQVKKDKNKKKKQILENIRKSVNGGGGLTMPELRDLHGYKYDVLQSFLRRGDLKFRRVRDGKRTKILITGVNF